AAAHRLEVDTDEQLIESENYFQGLRVSVGDGALREPRHWHKLINPLRPSWGEPYLQIARRMIGAAYAAREAAEGHEAVCVSHQLINPWRRAGGERDLQLARRMIGAAYAARESAEGHEAVCVSHQLPIWTLRRFVEGKRLWHDPRKRECSLASLTSFEFTGHTITAIRYAEPAGHTDPRVTGA